tara:strand:+ start:974 stop:2194 length:1221 start_codon:yes stop_codon:yes gene_type:complete
MINYYHKLIYLLPLALITGPFIPDLIVVLCSILFLIDTFRLKLFKYYKNNFFKIFMIFFLFLNLSSIFSINSVSFKYSLTYFRYGIFVIFIYYILKNYSNSKILLGYSIITTFIILLIDGYIQFIFGKNIFFFELQEYRPNFSYVTSFFNDEKKLGGFLSRMLPLLLVSFIFIREKYQNSNLNHFFSTIIFLIFFLTFLTTERVSIFITIIFFIGIFTKSNIFLKPKTMFFVIISIGLISLFYYYPHLYLKMKSIFYSSGILFPGYTNQGTVVGEYDLGKFIFSKFHHQQIISSIKIFLENPLFGIGAKNFKSIAYAWHPHNYHAQVLAELGIFSYLIIFSLFIYFVFEIVKRYFELLDLKNEIKFYLLIAFFLNLIPIPSADFFNNWVNIMIFLPVGYYLYINEK